MFKLGELGALSFGLLKLGELGALSFGMPKLGELGEISFEMLKLGLKITQNVVFAFFSILAFSTNFCPRIDYPYLRVS